MTWVKLDDQFFRNTKSLAAGKDGRLLYLAGLCYCASQLTDGRIPSHAVPVVAAEAQVKASAAARLVEVGLWAEVDGGYEVPDYLDYQPSAEKVKADRERERVKKERQRREPSGRYSSRESSRGDGGGDNGRDSPGDKSGESPRSRPTPLPSTHSSSSSTSGSREPPASPEARPEEEEILTRTWRALAQRDLEHRSAEAEPIRSPTSWLTQAAERRAAQHHRQAVELIREHPDIDPTALAELLDPPPDTGPPVPDADATRAAAEAERAKRDADVAWAQTARARLDALPPDAQADVRATAEAEVTINGKARARAVDARVLELAMERG